MNQLKHRLRILISDYLIIKHNHTNNIVCHYNEIDVAHQIKMIQIYPIKGIRQQRYEILNNIIKSIDDISLEQINMYNLLSLCTNEPNEQLTLTFVKNIGNK